MWTATAAAPPPLISAPTNISPEAPEQSGLFLTTRTDIISHPLKEKDAVRFLLCVGIGVLGATLVLLGLHFYLRAGAPPPSALFSEDCMERLTALATLKTCGNEAYKQVLMMAFEDGEDLVRAEAAERLAYLWGSRAEPALKRLIHDPSVLVRAGVVEGLRGSGSPPPPWLKKALKGEKSPLVRALVAEWEKQFAAP